MITIIALTQTAYTTACRIQHSIGGVVYGLKHRIDCPHTFENTTEFIQSEYLRGHTIIGVCATAILVRSIAPYIGKKTSDPAVISVCEEGHTIVPIIGGHYGGYDISHKLADLFNTKASITNAGNTTLGFSLDDLDEGWILSNPDLVKPIMAHMLDGGHIQLINDTPLPFAYSQYFTGDASAPYTVRITHKQGLEDDKTLVIYAPCVVVGMGCERHIPAENLVPFVDNVLLEHNIAPQSILHFTSIDIKVDEPAIKAVCQAYNKPLYVHDKETLQAYAVPNPSDVVYKEIGVYGVAESSTMASGADIIVEKTAQSGCTIAIGLHQGTPLKQGRTNGILHIVGVGAGDAKWRTAETVQALKSADVVVGYQLYLDLVADLIPNTPTMHSPLGEERMRCKTAVSLASTGKTVALVCSGDASIYALATLVFELLDTHPDKRDWHGVDIHIACGISAFQACSAKVGAPFNHDFCLLSLSDILTPTNTIIKRLHAVGQGDFVVALYNSQSKRRKTLLHQARDILLSYRPANTPVIIGRNIGRQDETISTTTLEDFDTSVVDMLTLVIIGNTETKTFVSAGRTLTYTPRGYTGKEPT